MIPNAAKQPIIKPTDFQFRLNTGIAPAYLFPSGCLVVAPVFESQIGKFFDTYGCVGESIANGFEMLFDVCRGLGLISDELWNWMDSVGFIINGRVRFSNRWLIVRSGTDPDWGNSGQVVVDFVRQNGLSPLSLCDWDMNNPNPAINNKVAYYDASTISADADRIAKELSKRVAFLYEWVNTTEWETASKEGVIQVYIKAWYKGSDGKYYSPNPGSSGHAINYGNHETITIIDQYDPQFKQIRALSDFYPIGLKLNIKEKTMEKPIIENNTLVQLVSGPGGFGMYLDGYIFVDNVAEILATVIVRNNGNLNNKIKPLLKEQWDLFPKKNLKNEIL